MGIEKGWVDPDGATADPPAPEKDNDQDDNSGDVSNDQAERTLGD